MVFRQSQQIYGHPNKGVPARPLLNANTYKSSLQLSPEGQLFLIEMCIIKGSPLFSHEKIEIIKIDNTDEN